MNGGFETGDFTGWTRSGNLGFTSVTNSPFYVNSGNFGASLGPVGSDGFLSQTLQTTPGTAYIVSFALRSDGLTANDFSASWGGQTFFSTSTSDSGTDFGLQLGGGVTFNLSETLGLRFAADYIRVFGDTDDLNAYRVAIGAVFPFWVVH